MKKKIAYILSRFPTVSETFILYEMIELIKLGMEIEIFPLIHQKGTTIHPEVRSVASHVHYPRYLSWRTFTSHFYWLRKKPITYLRTLLSALARNVRSPKFFSRALIVTFLAARTAREVEASGAVHIHAHAATHPTLMAYLVSRLTGIPYSFTAHSSDIYFNQTMLAEKLQRACFVATISNFNVAFLKRIMPNLAPEKIHVVRCGVDLSAFPEEAALERENHPPKIVCIGRLEEIKGHQYLIEACARLRSQNIDFHCYLVGDGELRSNIVSQVHRLGLEDQVKLLGFQTHDKVLELLKQVDILILPSLSEGIPVAAMEGMASGVPVVATDVTGVPELVEDGVTGLLVPRKDSAALAGAILKMIESPPLRSKMGKAGRKKVMAEFNLHQSAKDLYNIFLQS